MGVGIVDPGADHVGRQQVRRELQPRKRPVQRLGQCLDRQRLGQSRHTFEQHVPIRNQSQQKPVDQLLLTRDDPSHLGLDQLQRHRLTAHELLQLLDIFLFHVNPPLSGSDKRLLSDVY